MRRRISDLYNPRTRKARMLYAKRRLKKMLLNQTMAASTTAISTQDSKGHLRLQRDIIHGNDMNMSETKLNNFDLPKDIDKSDYFTEVPVKLEEYGEVTFAESNIGINVKTELLSDNESEAAGRFGDWENEISKDGVQINGSINQGVHLQDPSQTLQSNIGINVKTELLSDNESEAAGRFGDWENEISKDGVQINGSINQGVHLQDPTQTLQVKEESSSEQLVNSDFVPLESIKIEIEPTCHMEMMTNEELPSYGDNDTNNTIYSNITGKRQTSNQVSEECLLDITEFAGTSAQFDIDVKETKPAFKSNLLKNKLILGEIPKSKCVCDICKKEYDDKEKLVQHIGRHYRNNVICNSRIYHYCDSCEYKTKNRGHLNRHKLKHTHERPFSCRLCKYKSKHQFTLYNHMRTHTQERPYECHLCDYKATQKANLKRHIQTHTGEKPFKCNFCEHKTVQKSDLRKHMVTHTGDKPYKCNFCAYRCVEKVNMNSHILRHTGDKPFTCDLCSYGCARRRHLVNHIRKWH